MYFRVFQSERNGFSQFHTYVCAAFLRLWSRQLQSEKDFQVRVEDYSEGKMFH